VGRPCPPAGFLPLIAILFRGIFLQTISIDERDDPALRAGDTCLNSAGLCVHIRNVHSRRL
jgi:hypothetical protein